MENPSTWGEAEHIVYDTLLAIHNDDMEELTVGTSPARRVTDALRAAHLLMDDYVVNCPEHGYQRMFRVPGVANELTCMECI
jgi:hypothetical protein